MVHTGSEYPQGHGKHAYTYVTHTTTVRFTQGPGIQGTMIHTSGIIVHTESWYTLMIAYTKAHGI
jgi:hypothetical protein